MLYYLYFMLFSLLSCLSIQIGNPSLTILKNNGKQGMFAVSNSLRDDYKMGESCIRSFAGLISFGDASAETAQRNGKIIEVLSINHSIKTQYLFFQEYCTVLLGR